MKKLIATLSFVLTFGFAFALAHADEPRDTGQDQGTAVNQPSDQNQQPGMSQQMTQETPKAKDLSKDVSKDTSKDRLAMEKKWKRAKSCTDKDGVTYRRGQPGFESCIQAKINQMGGRTSDQMRDQSSGATDTHSPYQQAPATGMEH